MSVFRKLLSETASYGVSTMLGRLLNYLLVILHTSLFDPALLASQSQFYAYAGVLYVVYTFGMETTFFRFAKKAADLEKYYNLILSAVITVSMTLSTLLFVFAEQLASYLKYPGDTLLLKWFAVIMAIDGIVAIPFARLRLEKEVRKFVRIRIINILVNIGFNLFFLILCKNISEGKYLSSLRPLVNFFYFPEHAAWYIILANLIASVSYLFFLRKEFSYFRFHLNWSLFKPVWVYAFPIMVMNLAGVTNMLFDRAFLQFLLPDGFYPGRSTKDAIGIYTQAYKLSIFMNLAIQAFKYAAEPFFFSKAEDKNAPEVFAEVMKWFVIVCVMMWVLISINLDILAFVFLRKEIYHEGLFVIPWLLVGFLFLGIYYNLSTWFKITDRTEYGTYITLLGVSITVIMNLTLVPVIGYLACGIAFATSGVVMAICSYVFGQKFYPVPYHLQSGLAYIVSGALLVGLVSIIEVGNGWLQMAIKLVISIVYMVIVARIEWPHLPFGKMGRIHK